MKRTFVRLGQVIVTSLGFAVAAGAQQPATRLTGHIIDNADKAPIPGAAVLVTGTTIGTVTTDSGAFAIRLPSDAKTLTVRRIGYRATVVPLAAGSADITVALERDVLQLEQQVITGAATTVSSKNAANAVAVVTASAVTEVPAPTMENAIQGKVAGAIIQSNNGGAPGGGLQIQLRGVTSINGNASPLYVVDGIIVNNETINSDANAIAQSGGGVSTTGAPMANVPSRQDNSPNRIADINPEDIETIEILKGASASAIYGSKASAGVVVITTKKGTAGKPKWNFDGQLGHYVLANELPIRTFPTEQSAVAWDAEQRNPLGAATIKQLYAGPQDYQRQLFGNPNASYSANVSVSGQSNVTTYFLSALSKYDNGIENNTGYNKQSIRSNVTQQFMSNLSVSANLNYIHDVSRRGITGNDNIGISPYNVFSVTPQFMALDKPNADGTWEVNPFGSSNPFANAAEIQTPQEVSRFIGGGTLDWTTFQTEHQTLKLTLIGGADITSEKDLLFAPPDLQVEQQLPSGLPGTSVSNTSQNNYLNYSINLSHHYTGLSFLDATTSLGFSRDRRDMSNPVTSGFGLLAGPNAPTAGLIQQNFFNRTAQRDQSLYVQEQLLTFGQRLALTGGVTGERSTNDADVNKFYFYPRASASYRLPAFAFVDELKLRAAYGQSGNLPLYGAKYTPYNSTQIGGSLGISNNQIVGDPNIRPESETEIETGIDLTMFHERAQFSATIYQKRLTDLLLQASVAPSLGYLTEFFNGGEFTNQGLELTLTATPLQFRNGFTWTNTTTFARNYSVVNSLPVPPNVIGNTFGFGEGYLAVGRSVSEIVNSAAFGANGLATQVGDFQPAYRLDVGNEFTWKGFRVYGLFEWSRAGSTINLTDLYFDGGPGLWGDSAQSTNRLNAYLANSTAYVKDATFFKVRQLSVSYKLPDRLTNWALTGRVTSARIMLTGYNLWGIFKFDGLDPEVSINGNQTVTRGQDITPYPPAKSYFLGLNLGF